MLDEARTRLELKSGSHLFCIEIDKGPGGEGIARVYCCVVGAAYPTRFIFSAGASASSSSSSPPRAMADFRALVARALPPLGAGGEGEARARAEQKALKGALKGALKPLAARYSAAEGLDKVAQVQKKLEGLRGALVDNLVRATERDSLLEDLEVKTRTLRDGAAVMEGRALGMRRRACTKYHKGVVMGVIIALLILGAIVAGVTKSLKVW